MIYSVITVLGDNSAPMIINNSIKIKRFEKALAIVLL